MDRNLSTNHNPQKWHFEPIKVSFCKSNGSENRWLSRVRILLKGVVSAYLDTVSLLFSFDHFVSMMTFTSPLTTRGRKLFIVAVMSNTNQAETGLFVKYHRGHTLNEIRIQVKKYNNLIYFAVSQLRYARTKPANFRLQRQKCEEKGPFQHFGQS